MSNKNNGRGNSRSRQRGPTQERRNDRPDWAPSSSTTSQSSSGPWTSQQTWPGPTSQGYGQQVSASGWQQPDSWQPGEGGGNGNGNGMRVSPPNNAWSQTSVRGYGRESTTDRNADGLHAWQQSPYAGSGYGDDSSRYRRDGAFDSSSDHDHESDMSCCGPHAGCGPRTYERADTRIEEDVNERLSRHGLIDAIDVQVRVAEGVVTLAGEVADRDAKRLAEDIAEDCTGVKQVVNQLRARAGRSGAARSDARPRGNGATSVAKDPGQSSDS